MQTNPPTAPLLLVEDDENDILLIKRVFVKAGVRESFQVVKNGSEAIAYLAGKAGYADRTLHPLPCLVLLDLKMPGMSGFEVLTWLRSQPEFLPLRVVILTSSDTPQDVNRAYQLGANSYLVKTTDMDRFVENVKALARYWLTMDQLGEEPPEDSLDVDRPAVLPL